MRGLSSRVLEGKLKSGHQGDEVSSERAIEPSVGLMTMSSVWNVIPLPEKNPLFPAKTDQVVMIGGIQEQRNALREVYPNAHPLDFHSGATIEEMASQLNGLAPLQHIVWIAPEWTLKGLTEESLIQEQTQGVLQIFRLVKALLASGYGARELGLTVITTQTQAVRKKDVIYPAHAGIHGLIGSLAKEYPNWKIRLLDVEAGCDWPIQEMFMLPVDIQGDALAYRGKEWFRQALIPVRELSGDLPPYRSKGVYVVIGGAGGIGEAWSRVMIEEYQARIIWIGRRKKDETIQAKLDAIAQVGPKPIYIQADATNLESLQKAYGEIKQFHAKIHGVIHSAIVLLDKSLTTMDEERFQAGLSAKVDVSVRLAQVFQIEALDFVLFFSSMISFTKAPGQSNYAAGCTFKDAFAHQLAKEWSCAVKIMNWGYWGSVGIATDPIYKERVQRAGIGSIEPEEGMEALESLLQGSTNQVAFTKTVRPGALEVLCTEEWMRISPEAIPSCIDSLQKHFPPQKIQVEPLQSAGNQQGAEMEGLLLKLLWSSLQSLGLFKEEELKLSDFKVKTNLLNLYDRWFKESLRVLRAKKYLQQVGQIYTVNAPSVDLEALWNHWDEAKLPWLEDIHQKARVVLVETTLRALPEILTGKKKATDIIFPNSSMELVEEIYKGNQVSDFFNNVLGHTVVAYLQERLADPASASIRILEIGAGTGGTTAGLLPRLRPFRDYIQAYCYTDISKAFLMHAEEEYAPENPYLTMQLFDVSKPLSGQNIQANHYDLVIAANALHATKNIRQTLRNAKATLQKNGLLVLNELSDKSLFAHLTFGLLEGWWLYEDAALRIPGCPGLYPETWAEVLEEEGFNATLFPAQAAHGLGQQIIVAESDGVIRQQQPSTSEIVPVRERNQTRTNRIPTMKEKKAQASRLQEHSYKMQTTNRGNMNVTDQMVEDYVRSILRENIAEALKMEEGQIQDDRSFSEIGVDSIIAVQLVNKINKACQIVLQTTVLFDYNNVDQLTRHIIKEHQSTFRITLQENSPPVQEAALTPQQEGLPVKAPTQKIRYPDLRTQSRRNRFQRREDPQWPQNVVLAKDNTTYHRVIIEGPGAIEDLRMVEASVPELGPHEVRIAVRAFSLNFADLLCVKGLYPTMPPYPFTPGFEVSGIVVALGNAVTSVSRGNSVIAIMGEHLGGHGTMATCLDEQVFQKPATLSFEEACALPGVAITMIDAFSKANLQPGERILIQTAAGGTGLIAVQLAQYANAEIYATAGSKHKLDYLQKLGVPHLINYQATDFESEIHRLTDGQGVDVVINTLSGEAIQKGMNCLSAGGRYIEIAMTALKSAKTIDLSVLSNNQSFYSVDLRKLERKNPEKFQSYRAEMIRLFENGVLSPTVFKVFPFDQIKEAYRSLEDRRNIGKLVVRIPEVYRYQEISLPESNPRLNKFCSFSTSPATEAIAIIGMSGRFAKSETLKAFWGHLSQGTDLVEEVSRWDLSKYNSGPSSNGNYCNQGSFLENIDQFDPLFFKISPLEARYMDPQQRLFLEESWKALEDAGYAGESIQEKPCGIYVGCAGGDYPKLFPDNPPAQAFWGNAGSIIPARIAYYLNLQGPAVAVDTACSSSLVAIHLACQGLWTKEIDLALGGGVFIQSTPEFYRLANRAGMLSPTGRCHTLITGLMDLYRAKGWVWWCSNDFRRRFQSAITLLESYEEAGSIRMEPPMELQPRARNPRNVWNVKSMTAFTSIPKQFSWSKPMGQVQS